MINALGTFGGQVGPSVVGWLRQGSAHYTSGLLVLAATLAAEALVISLVKLPKPASGE
jgi:hypothetical protein